LSDHDGLAGNQSGAQVREPSFLVNQDTGCRTTAYWFLGILLQRLRATIALSSCERGRVVPTASVTFAVCFLWLFVGAVGNDALCGESDSRAQALIAEQAYEHGQDWDRAEALARALTSALQGELDAVRSTAEMERIKQKQLLDQERGRADTLSRELASLQAELDKARIIGLEAAQATEAEAKQEQALVQERDRANTLARELASLRAELDEARTAGPEVAQAAEAAIKQKQALDQERERAENLARELTSVRADLDAARAAAQTTEAAKVEQERAFGKERDKAEALARELTAARKEADDRSAILAAVQAVVLKIAEADKAIAADEKQVLARERERANTLGRALVSARDELEAGKRQIAAPNASCARPSR